MNYLNFSLDGLKLPKQFNEKYNTILFYLDIASMTRGYYNPRLMRKELDIVFGQGIIPNTMLENLRTFLKHIENTYKQFNCKFILFYDVHGKRTNVNLDSNYKGNRKKHPLEQNFTEMEMKIYHRLKKCTFDRMYDSFNIENKCCVIKLDGIEADLVPDILIEHVNEQQSGYLNIILTVDKDLAQTCRYKNTLMYTSMLSPKTKKWLNNFLTNSNAMKYVCKSDNFFKLTAKYVPMFLSIAGDKADNVPNLFKGCGPAKALKLINESGGDLDVTNGIPPSLEEYKDRLLLNLKLTSFTLQKELLTSSMYNEIFSKFNTIHDVNIIHSK